MCFAPCMFLLQNTVWLENAHPLTNKPTITLPFLFSLPQLGCQKVNVKARYVNSEFNGLFFCQLCNVKIYVFFRLKLYFTKVLTLTNQQLLCALSHEF